MITNQSVKLNWNDIQLIANYLDKIGNLYADRIFQSAYHEAARRLRFKKDKITEPWQSNWKENWEQALRSFQIVLSSNEK